MDHLVFGVPDLAQGIDLVERHTGVRARFGGQHPGRGTHNALLSLGEPQYLEIIARDPAQRDAPGLLFHGLEGLSDPRFIAWDAATGKKVWGITERFPVWSGALVTAGDVVFYGTVDGWFKAADAHTGKVLWQFKTGSGIIGKAMTFAGPDQKQYVAVYAGIGGWLGAVALGLSTDDPTAALGAVGAAPDLPQYTAPGGTVYVFGL